MDQIESTDFCVCGHWARHHRIRPESSPQHALYGSCTRSQCSCKTFRLVDDGAIKFPTTPGHHWAPDPAVHEFDSNDATWETGTFKAIGSDADVDAAIDIHIASTGVFTTTLDKHRAKWLTVDEMTDEQKNAIVNEALDHVVHGRLLLPNRWESIKAVERPDPRAVLVQKIADIVADNPGAEWDYDQNRYIVKPLAVAEAIVAVIEEAHS